MLKGIKPITEADVRKILESPNSKPEELIAIVENKELAQIAVKLYEGRLDMLIGFHPILFPIIFPLIASDKNLVKKALKICKGEGLRDRVVELNPYQLSDEEIDLAELMVNNFDELNESIKKKLEKNNIKVTNYEVIQRRCIGLLGEDKSLYRAFFKALEPKLNADKINIVNNVLRKIYENEKELNLDENSLKRRICQDLIDQLLSEKNRKFTIPVFLHCTFAHKSEFNQTHVIFQNFMAKLNALQTVVGSAKLYRDELLEKILESKLMDDDSLLDAAAIYPGLCNKISEDKGVLSKLSVANLSNMLRRCKAAKNTNSSNYYKYLDFFRYAFLNNFKDVLKLIDDKIVIEYLDLFKEIISKDFSEKILTEKKFNILNRNDQLNFLIFRNISCDKLIEIYGGSDVLSGHIERFIVNELADKNTLANFTDELISANRKFFSKLLALPSSVNALINSPDFMDFCLRQELFTTFFGVVDSSSLLKIIGIIIDSSNKTAKKKVFSENPGLISLSTMHINELRVDGKLNKLDEAGILATIVDISDCERLYEDCKHSIQSWFLSDACDVSCIQRNINFVLFVIKNNKFLLDILDQRQLFNKFFVKVESELEGSSKPGPVFKIIPPFADVIEQDFKLFVKLIDSEFLDKSLVENNKEFFLKIVENFSYKFSINNFLKLLKLNVIEINQSLLMKFVILDTCTYDELFSVQDSIPSLFISDSWKTLPPRILIKLLNCPGQKIPNALKSACKSNPVVVMKLLSEPCFSVDCIQKHIHFFKEILADAAKYEKYFDAELLEKLVKVKDGGLTESVKTVVSINFIERIVANSSSNKTSADKMLEIISSHFGFEHLDCERLIALSLRNEKLKELVSLFFIKQIVNLKLEAFKEGLIARNQEFFETVLAAPTHAQQIIALENFVEFASNKALFEVFVSRLTSENARKATKALMGSRDVRVRNIFSNNTKLLATSLLDLDESEDSLTYIKTLDAAGNWVFVDESSRLTFYQKNKSLIKKWLLEASCSAAVMARNANLFSLFLKDKDNNDFIQSLTAQQLQDKFFSDGKIIGEFLWVFEQIPELLLKVIDLVGIEKEWVVSHLSLFAEIIERFPEKLGVEVIGTLLEFNIEAINRKIYQAMNGNQNLLVEFISSDYCKESGLLVLQDTILSLFSSGRWESLGSRVLIKLLNCSSKTITEVLKNTCKRSPKLVEKILSDSTCDSNYIKSNSRFFSEILLDSEKYEALLGPDLLRKLLGANDNTLTGVILSNRAFCTTKI